MLRLFLAPALCLSIALVADAEQDSLSVDVVISRHIEARGGYDAIKSVQTVVYKDGQYSEPGYTGSGDAFMAFRRPYFKVVGNPDAPRSFMEGWDGSAWEWFEDPGVVIRTVGAASGATRRSSEFEGPLIDYREKGHEIELGKPDTIGGNPAYRLIVTMMDGFKRDYFIDQDSYLIVAERRTAPFHAYGEPVTTETRYEDYRQVAGVLFPHRYEEKVIDTGETQTSMQWGSIEANRELPPEWFSPPQFEHTDLQRFLEQLYAARTDVKAVLWTYRQFRRFHPDIETRAGVELIGYQFLKMGEIDQAVALLSANVADYPGSASSVFGFARALAATGDTAAARTQYERALSLEPNHRRAAAALRDLDKPRG